MERHPMPFDDCDVEKIAAHLETRHPLIRRLFGLESRGVSRVLRSLWSAGDEVVNKLTTVQNAFEITSDELRHLRRQLRRSVTFLIDEAMERYGVNKSFVIVLSPDQFRRLDEEYDCPDKKRASTRERWAYTYKGRRVFTMASIMGPLLMDATAFEKLNTLRTDLSIREM